MPCVYISTSVFADFTDRATLDLALKRVDRRRYTVRGLVVEAEDQTDLNELRQAYQVEAAKQTAKKKGFFVQERRLPDGKIRLTVRR
jgi:uncharacterized protein YbjT (DUF2867 family)